ncbi:MAG: hypothetical protein JOZ54_18180 [Acidobacteria bacterium]|nr:hypothetical protein [Acidobacteriota bacterium]
MNLAVEIIHRGIERGWDTFDVMSPLSDVLASNAEAVVTALESIARESVAVRRVLWRLKRQTRPFIGTDAWQRLMTVTGETTDYTELETPVPPPRPQLDADEEIIAAWFVYEENFWSFSEVHDLCDSDPALAWSLTQELIARAEDAGEIGAIAAGPLEKLVREHADRLWPAIVAKAHADRRFVSALRGIWVFEEDGEVYAWFQELMRDVDAEPN